MWYLKAGTQAGGREAEDENRQNQTALSPEINYFLSSVPTDPGKMPEMTIENNALTEHT